MPPYVPRKRHNAAKRNESSPTARPSKRRATAASTSSGGVFEAIDTLDPTPSKESAEKTRAYLAEADDDDDAMLTSENEEDGPFEDVIPQHSASAINSKDGVDDETEDEEEDWEDAIPAPAIAAPAPPTGVRDLQLTISAPEEAAPLTASTGKRGPTKMERMIRSRTHCLHVLCLVWFNTIRNSWLNDAEVQATLRAGLGEGLQAEVLRWRRSSGMVDEEEDVVRRKATKRRGRARKDRAEQEDDRDEVRDWGPDASRLEPAVPNMRGGDPIVRLLKHLVAYWKKRFTVTAPPLRKEGYRSVREREAELRAFAKNPKDSKRFGERIENIEQFRQLAKSCRGSRDVGAQLFTALLRAIGIEARMAASLQPSGFGWSQAEEAKKVKSESGNDQGLDGGQSSKQGSSSAPILIDDSSGLSDAMSVETDLDMDIPKLKNDKPPGKELPYPIYWTEVLSPLTNTYIAVSTETVPTIVSSGKTSQSATENFQAFEPRGAAAEKAKQVICYVVAHSSDGTAKDVTVRYLKRRQLPGKTKGFRYPPEKMGIYTQRGKLLKVVEVDWFKRVMNLYTRPMNKRTVADDIEDQGDLVPYKPQKDASKSDAMPETLQGYKNSTEFVLERHLRREEAILPTAERVKVFTTGKGEKAKKEAVYLRKDVVSCKTVESWQKEGREIRMGEQPLKLVPIRAVTLIRKLEVEQSARQTGEKPLQGLYSRDQTDWIIPPPIKDGKIPKNAYGNIDVYVPSMIPAGAAHVPLRGTVRVCKKLGIDYAEACTGFEFGHQMAVPIMTGVVVAEENAKLLVDAWKQEEERKRIREDEKRRKATLAQWRKFIVGLRIAERIKEEYGNAEEEIDPFANKKVVVIPSDDDDDDNDSDDDDDDENDNENENDDENDSDEKKDPNHTKELISDSEHLGGGFLTSDGPDQDVYSHEYVPKRNEATEMGDADKGEAGDYKILQPKSLRAAIRSNPDADDENGEGDDLTDPNSSADSDDEEYTEFVQKRPQSKGKGRARDRDPRQRLSRQSATTSPYFRSRK